MKLFAVSLAVLSSALLPLAAQAQTSTDLRTDYLDSLKLKLPDFRLIKKIEPFPERYNASVELPVRASWGTGEKTARALATLHDGITGEPLESCYTPCVLHKSPGRKVFVFPFKTGHFTSPIPIELDPSGMREKYPYWGNDYEIRLGPDFRRAFLQRKICAAEFEKMNRNDRDAEPCYRMPPPLPHGNYSGYCRVIFDVTPEGATTNAKIRECSDNKFEIASLVAVAAWTYHPKIERGMPVTRTGVKTKLRFDITDFDGTLLDENGKRVEE